MFAEWRVAEKGEARWGPSRRRSCFSSNSKASCQAPRRLICNATRISAPAMGPARIALVGDFDPGVTAHQAIEKCFVLAAQAGSLLVEPVWLATELIVPRD